MYLLVLLPFFLQLVIISIDECVFHLKRGLPKWERIGHPFDTLSVAICLSFIYWVPFSFFALKIYIGLAIFSCLLVTKDEFVHKHCCSAAEQWLHAFLFLNHPILLTAAALIWPLYYGATCMEWLLPWKTALSFLTLFIRMQIVFAFSFFFYQVVYWNFIWKEKKQ